MVRAFSFSLCVAVLFGCEGAKAPEIKRTELARYQWDASPEIWETKEAIFPGVYERPDWRWASYEFSVPLKCELRGDRIFAVPLDKLEEEQADSHTWDTTAATNMFSKWLAKDGQKPSNIELNLVQPKVTVREGSSTILQDDGCFHVRYKARFSKNGGKLSAVVHMAEGEEPKTLKHALDNDANADTLTGLVQICCCLWDKRVPVIAPGETPTADPVPVDSFETVPDLEHVGYDWIAARVEGPERKEGSLPFSWKGSFETKECGYSATLVGKDEKTVRVPAGWSPQTPQGRPAFDPENEEQDANNQTFDEL